MRDMAARFKHGGTPSKTTLQDYNYSEGILYRQTDPINRDQKIK
jgi:hypothetical protein